VGELVEVVERDGTVVRVVERAVMRAERLRHRAVFIAVLDHEGRLLVHRRSEEKDVWPGRWDLAAGGVVGVGEPWDEAARRELAEELGLTDPVELVGDGCFEDEDVALVGRVYRCRSDGPVTFADGEVVEARWVTPEELAALRAEVAFVPDSVALVLPLLDLG